MNVARLVADHALQQAVELEAEADALLAKARERYEQAAVCRMLAATAGPASPREETT